MLGKITSILAILVFITSASKESLPKDIFKGHIPKSRSLGYIGCQWVDDVNKEFCCEQDNESDCQEEYNWFMEESL